MKRLTFILLVLFAGIQSVMAQRFELVTSTSQLESDARYIFVNSKTPGESAQMMSGNSLDLGSIHTIGGTRVTIGQDGIIDLSPSGILGWLGNALTRPEHCIYTLNKSQNGILGIGQKWIAYNYQGKALSTKRDEVDGGLLQLLNLMGQARLVDVTEETEDIQLSLSFRNDQVYVHSGEDNIAEIAGNIFSALGNLGNIQEDPTAALAFIKLLDPFRYLTASNIGAAGLTFTSTFTFNVPLDQSVITDMITNPNIQSIINILSGISTNLYLYKEIEEPTTYELVTDLSQIVSGEDYVILNEKETKGSLLGGTHAYALGTKHGRTVVGIDYVEATDVVYDKFENKGAYILDGQSYVDVRPRVKRVIIDGNTENGYYISCEGKVLSAISEAKKREIDFTNDSTYARMSIDIESGSVATIKAMGLSKDQYNHLQFFNSATKGYTFDNDGFDLTGMYKDFYLYRKAKAEKLPTPVIDPKSNNGTILGWGADPFVDPQTVTITCATEGAHIYYTLDGSEPTSSSLVYNGPFVVDGPCTVKAIAMYRINKSDVASATYIFKKQAPEYVFSTVDGKVMLAPKTIKEGETISYTVQSKGMNNVTGNFTTDNASVEVTAAPYAGQEFYVEGKTSATNFTTSDTGSAAYTYTDNLHVTASFDFADLSTGAYNNKAKVERTDNEGWNHTTSASANLTISNGALRIGNNQTFTINATVLPYSTITVATTNKVKINGETITPINGLATWHNENAVKEISIQTGETSSMANLWNPSSTITSVKVTMPKYVEVTIGSTGYASYCPIYFDVVAPENLTVYYVDATYADYMHLSEAANTIQMGEGVILNGEPGTYKLWISETPASAISGNFLYGSMEDTYFEQDEVYLLSYKNNILKFRHNTAGTLPAGKAYLKSSDVPNSQSAHEFTMVFGDDATAIESTVADTNDSEMYNIQGQRVSNSYKGVVIINGNKYLKK